MLGRSQIAVHSIDAKPQIDLPKRKRVSLLRQDARKYFCRFHNISSVFSPAAYVRIGDLSLQHYSDRCGLLSNSEQTSKLIFLHCRLLYAPGSARWVNRDSCLPPNDTCIHAFLSAGKEYGVIQSTNNAGGGMVDHCENGCEYVIIFRLPKCFRQKDAIDRVKLIYV